MSQLPKSVEILDPVDRWLHLLALLGGVGALLSGPLLAVPQRSAQLGIEWPLVASLHGGLAGAAGLAWAFHLVRVCLAWLEGTNPSGLVPRPSDIAELLRGVGYGCGALAKAPRRGRFSYRERVPYLVFLLSLPLLVVSGWFLAHPLPASRLLGASGLLLTADLHAAAGVALVPFLCWHLFFAHLQPGALFWNGAWLTGRAPWVRVEAMRPEWAAEIAASLSPEAVAEEEPPSVEELLGLGNQAARSEDWPAAAAAYREALRLYPGYSQARFNLGVVLHKGGDSAAAAEALEEFLRQDPFGPAAGKAQQLLNTLRGGAEGG